MSILMLVCWKSFSQFLDPNNSIRSWLTAALPLAISPFFAEAEADDMFFQY